MSRFSELQQDPLKREIPNIHFRNACEADSEAIGLLLFKRDGNQNHRPVTEFVERAQKELKGIKSSGNLHMVVALHDGLVVGYGRSIFYDMPKESVDYSAPTGWYLMGLLVDRKFRNCGIGKKLTELRIDRISTLADEVYYIVNAKNQVSIFMHERLGFATIDEGHGFMKISFDGGKGYLCRKKLSD